MQRTDLEVETIRCFRVRRLLLGQAATAGLPGSIWKGRNTTAGVEEVTVMRICQHSLAILLMFWILSLTSGVADADTKLTITTAGPSWARFTNEDGSGLYHEIIREVFAGYEVNHLYVTTTQANAMVSVGRADIKMCETKEIPDLVLADIPMYENDFYALYLKERMAPWQGVGSLAGGKVVWREGYYSQADFPVFVNFIEVRSGESALAMVLHHRASFYIDDLSLIKQSFASAGEHLDPQKFGLERAGIRKYYPVFAATVRGRSLLRQYREAMERLYADGRLQTIYRRWGFPVPKFNFGTAGRQPAETLE